MTRSTVLRLGIIAASMLVAAEAGSKGADTTLPVVALRSLTTPAAPASGEPHLAVAPDGTVFLSWFEKRDSTRHALRLSRLDGDRWSKPTTIAEGDSFFVNWADFPIVLALDRDHLVAGWPWKHGSGTYAYDVHLAQSFDGGRTWSRGTIPHRDGTATEHGFISLVPAGPGARAVWLDGRKAAADTGKAGGASHDEEGHAEMALRAAVIAPDGSLLEEQELDGRVCDCCQTAAVSTSRGVLVGYRDRSAEEIRDISLVRLEGGSWSEPYALHDDGWNIAGCPVNGPSMDAAGERVVAAWFTMAADTPRVHVSFSSDAGHSFGPPIRVDGGDPLGRTDVLLLDDGSALVTWLETQDKQALVQVRRVTTGVASSQPLTVASTATSRGSGFPRMVRSGSRVVFAWTQAGKPSRVMTAVARLP